MFMAFCFLTYFKVAYENKCENRGLNITTLMRMEIKKGSPFPLQGPGDAMQSWL